MLKDEVVKKKTKKGPKKNLSQPMTQDKQFQY